MDYTRQIPVTKNEQCPNEGCLSNNVSPTGVVSGSGARWPNKESQPLITHYSYRCNDCGQIFTVYKGQ